jgi:hypothetical protein
VDTLGRKSCDLVCCHASRLGFSCGLSRDYMPSGFQARPPGSRRSDGRVQAHIVTAAPVVLMQRVIERSRQTTGLALSGTEVLNPLKLVGSLGSISEATPPSDLPPTDLGSPLPYCVPLASLT